MTSKEERTLYKANKILKNKIDAKYVHMKKKWQALHDMDLHLSATNSRKTKNEIEAYKSDLKKTSSQMKQLEQKIKRTHHSANTDEEQKMEEVHPSEDSSTREKLSKAHYIENLLTKQKTSETQQSASLETNEKHIKTHLSAKQRSSNLDSMLQENSDFHKFNIRGFHSFVVIESFSASQFCGTPQRCVIFS